MCRPRSLCEQSGTMIIRNILLAFLALGVPLCNGYRFLAIFPFEMKSHRGVLEPIVEELAIKGHQVDVISTFPLSMSLPNYTNIIRLPTSETPMRITYQNITNFRIEYKWLFMLNCKICELLGHPEINKLIKNPPTDPPYDLLIVHQLSGYQCMSAIGVAWNIPIVGVVTTMPYPQMHHYINNPLSLATMSRHYRSYEDKLGFWDRVYNVVMSNYYMYFHYKTADVQDYYIKKYLGPEMPSYREVEKSYSLILSNSHYLYHGVKPQVPALIEIGGINVKNDSSELEPRLKKVLDESKDGFIYFSFGSIMVIETLPREVLERFYAVIRKISPVRVVMKTGNPEAMPKNLPNNVFTFPWLQQQKILQHPNIKAFVTHGGALGTQEAIYYKVPMICVPFFAEQRANCDISNTKNISLTLLIKSAEQKDFDYVFNQILTNPRYKNSMRRFSALYYDRPQKPREAVTYWIEYVLRHGKDVLKTRGLDLQWWKLELFDVYVFLLSCTLAILFVVIFIVRKMCRLIFGKLSTIQNVKLSKKLQ